MQIPQVFIDLLDSNSYLFRISWRAISSLASLTRRLSWVWLWADTARNSVWQRSSSFLISSSNFCKNKYGYYRIKMRNPVFIVTLCTLYILQCQMTKKFCKRNWVFVTNSDFLISISLRPNFVDLRYF